MKAYLITTGTVFGLITLAHIWHVVADVAHLRDPVFLTFTFLALGLCLWAFLLLRRVSSS